MDWQTVTSAWGFNYAFAAGILVTIAITCWTYSPKELWKLSYHVESSTIVDHQSTAFSEKILVAYDGKPIPRATLSRVYVWNSGNRVLRRANITPKDPLIVGITDGQQILQTSIRSVATPAMDVEILPEDDSNVAVQFEYLEPRHGFICEILHTGTNHSLAVGGTLVSAKIPQKEELPFAPITIGPFFLVMVLGAVPPMGFLALATNYFKPTPENPLFSGLGGITFFVASGLFISLLFYLESNRPSRKCDFGTTNERE